MNKKENKYVIYVTTIFLTKRKISHNLLHQDNEICFFCNDIALLQRLLNTNTIQISGVCLMTNSYLKSCAST